MWTVKRSVGIHSGCKRGIRIKPKVSLRLFIQIEIEVIKLEVGIHLKFKLEK